MQLELKLNTTAYSDTNNKLSPHVATRDCASGCEPSAHAPTLSLAQSAPEPWDDDEPFAFRPEGKGVAAGNKLRCKSAQTRVNIVLRQRSLRQLDSRQFQRRTPVRGFILTAHNATKKSARDCVRERFETEWRFSWARGCRPQGKMGLQCSIRGFPLQHPCVESVETS